MITSNFNFISSLQYRVKSLDTQVKAFESGERYVSIREEFRRQLSAKDSQIRKLAAELAASQRQTSVMRENWMQVFDDIQAEHEKEIGKKDGEAVRLKLKVQQLEAELAETKGKLFEKTKELYRVMTELEEEKGISQKLTAQINRDYENSSIPSSLKINRKKIKNSRTKTGRKVGGQCGHEWHGRKKQEPTRIIEIPVPDEYKDPTKYSPTDTVITKQVVNVRIELDVVEYRTPEFRNLRTGQRVHADFPDGVNDEVNYGGSVKAFTFLLNSRNNVSIDNTRSFLADLTDGKLTISKGMVNGLCREFSRKTQEEQKEAFADILLSPVMNVDFTGSRVNGENAQVMVCATPDITLYFAREHKGHEGVKGTPVEIYQNTMVHDHDKTFLSYARWHQECMAHILRYLLDSIENESHLTWNRDMRELIQEMIHYINGLDEDEIPSPEIVGAFEAEFQKILDKAKEEYNYDPPTKYYREGFNLAQRMDRYKDNHLRFLYDKNVPATNNLAERLLRKFKRKQKQAVTFRSFENLDYLCNCMSMLSTLGNKGENLFKNTSSIFERRIERV